MVEFPTFEGSRPWPWPSIRSYCIPSCITSRPLLQAKFHWNRRNFLWTDGRAYGQIFETGYIRSTRRSRPKMPRIAWLLATTSMFYTAEINDINYADFGPDYWTGRPWHEPLADRLGDGAPRAPWSQRCWLSILWRHYLSISAGGTIRYKTRITSVGSVVESRIVWSRARFTVYSARYVRVERCLEVDELCVDDVRNITLQWAAQHVTL